MSTKEMRHYIRHPIEIPIAVKTVTKPGDETPHTQSTSAGGLCFLSPTALEVGSYVNVEIKAVTPVFTAQCKVTWCHPKNGLFEIGICFTSDDEAYRARMVQQVCHIERFRHELAAARNTDVANVSTEEAAKQWINQHAASFPS